MMYWFFKNLVAGPLLMTVFRPVVVGRENIPKDGAVIFAGNHLSFIDSVFLPLVLERQIFFLAKSEYWQGKGIKGWLSRMFFKGTGMIPIDRSDSRASEASLNTGLAVLAQGQQLGIYPEGTRSPDGRMYRGRTGVARMILEGGVPVVPVAMIDTDRVMPTGTKIPRVHRIGIAFGEPMDFSRFEGLQSDRFVLRSITDEIMYELNRLSGQEYVDVYASSVKDRAASPTRAPASVR
jgi:1-acyl-sn-glycerol-3-phosphate acyltransferase